MATGAMLIKVGPSMWRGMCADCRWTSKTRPSKLEARTALQIHRAVHVEPDGTHL